MQDITSKDSLVFNFDQDRLFLLLSESPDSKVSDSYKQARYLYEYLAACKCKTIIVEEQYTDKDYLDDYLHFYATCHHPYPKTCKRLHFFTEKIGYDDVIPKDESGISAGKLKDHYLGFVVVRPIQSIAIGRTVLKSYEDTNSDTILGFLDDKRHIFTTKEYKANLFGNPLKIDSIAFQQQDSVVSACATVALWTVLQKTSSKFGYYTPTSYEITQSANLKYSPNRPIPSTGLQVTQVIDSIHHYGMECEVIDYSASNRSYLTPDFFLASCYAYLRGGFPIFLGVDIEKLGLHALSLLGYKIGVEHQGFSPNVNFIGNRLNILYAHDDNIGAFARFEITQNTISIDDKRPPTNIINLRRDDYKDEKGNILKITPQCAIIPLYHKIRCPFSKIKGYLFDVSGFIKSMAIVSPNTPEEEISIAWDCYITEINDFKEATFQQNLPLDIRPSVREHLLLTFAPRFIWRCTLFINKVPLIELLADATDAGTRNPFFTVFFYDDDIKKVFAKVLDNGISRVYLKDQAFYMLLKKESQDLPD